MYNHHVKKHGKELVYQLINNGEKMKFVYLKIPNPTAENVSGFINTLPKEFELAKYIDYDLQFEKSFVEPFKLILEKIGWSTEPTSSLEEFFG